jgi:hypothetical protein
MGINDPGLQSAIPKTDSVADHRSALMAENIGYGQQTPFDVGSDYNVLQFIVKQLIARISTMKLVRVDRRAPRSRIAARGRDRRRPAAGEPA